MIAAMAMLQMDAGSFNTMTIGIVMLTGFISTAAVLYPLTRAWARRIEGKARDDGSLNRIDELSDRVQELEGQVSRMQELEDRLEFAERLLTEARHGFPERKLNRGSREAGVDTPPEPVDVR